MPKINPFEVINSITHTKEVVITEENEADYPAFMVNRGLSYFPDTVMLANMMNEYPNLDPLLQYDFYLNMISKKKRFAKWYKPEKVDNLALISEYYNVSFSKAERMLAILSDEQVEIIRQKLQRGGKQ